MTEDEAKTKWCPFTRVVENGSANNGHNRVQNRSGDDIMMPIASKCIASACMAWRGGGVSVKSGIPFEQVAAWQQEGFSVTLTEREDTYTAKKNQPGYCGLAGAPQ